MEGEHGSGGSKHSGMHPEPISDPLIEGKVSCSSSSSSSSFDPLLESDGEKDISVNSCTKSEQDGNSLPRPGPLDVSSQPPEWSMVSASPGSVSSSPRVTTQNPEWSMLSASPRQSPPVQTMGRPTGYDPNRIPSSIFAGKPTSPMEWSVASNESLFSIHMGNNSFSRDHAILLRKSGELTTIDESINSPTSWHPVTDAMFNERKSTDMGNSQVKAAAYETPPPRMVSEETAEYHSKEKMPHVEGARTSGSTARLSNESGNSSSSFAFPVFEGAGGRSGSVKAVPEKRKSQPQTPVVTTKAAGTKWFSCFSCFSGFTCFSCCRLCC
uniref:Uncharacterized protein n=1 Tax=Davidia involucrata TaxID=16924 RepID=A0A5B7BCM3_DAVIN